MNTQDERKAFEEWADARCYYLDKREDGNYEKSSTALAWEIAQYFMAIGRGKIVELEGCVVVPTTPSYEMWSGIARHLGRYMQMHDRYCPQTLKKYFDRFIGDIPEWLNKEVKDWDSDHAFATADLPAFIYMSMVEAARGGNHE